MLVCFLLHATTKTAQSHQKIHKPGVITETWPLMANTTNLKSSSACYSHWTDQNRSVISTRPTTMHLSMHRVKLCLDCCDITAKNSIFLNSQHFTITMCEKSVYSKQVQIFHHVAQNNHDNCWICHMYLCDMHMHGQTHARAHTQEHTHTHTHTHSLKHACMHTRARARAHTHSSTHARTHNSKSLST